MIEELFIEWCDPGTYEYTAIGRAQRGYLARYREMAAAYPQVLVAQRTLFQMTAEYLDNVEEAWRAALRVQPDLAEAQNNLATLLAGRRAYQEAAYHFEKAIRSDPAYVEAHHGYGLVKATSSSYSI